MKIYVYAICKNEAAFAERWMRSMSEADGVYVLDTGSDDGSAELLSKLGAHVTVETVSPWRFDTARNRSLELVPKDAELCVCTDLDEIFHSGWRKKLEGAFRTGVKQMCCRYTWSFNPDGSEGYVFWRDKIHVPEGFRWVNPVHEVLQYFGTEPMIRVNVEGVQLDHRADSSKSRAQYLPLLELAVRERPDDDRNMHYLGREYMFRRRWDDCVRTLERHLAMKSAVWPDERCASMRYIARAKLALGSEAEAERWLLRACGEAPHLREPWLELARLEFRRGAWSACLAACERALQIKERPRSYISEADSWGSEPYDLAAISCWRLGLGDMSLNYGLRALELSPNDDRLKSNLSFYRSLAADTAKAP